MQRAVGWSAGVPGRRATDGERRERTSERPPLRCKWRAFTVADTRAKRWCYPARPWRRSPALRLDDAHGPVVRVEALALCVLDAQERASGAAARDGLGVAADELRRHELEPERGLGLEGRERKALLDGCLISPATVKISTAPSIQVTFPSFAMLNVSVRRCPSVTVSGSSWGHASVARRGASAMTSSSDRLVLLDAFV
jgi:hypothetical protein